jgi:hypothetical protein
MLERVTDENYCVWRLHEHLGAHEWGFLGFVELAKFACIKGKHKDVIVPRLVPRSVYSCDDQKLAVVRPLRISGYISAYFLLEYYFVFAILDRELHALRFGILVCHLREDGIEVSVATRDWVIEWGFPRSGANRKQQQQKRS